MLIHLTVNGIQREINIKPHDYLLDILRKMDISSVKRGCDSGSCGVCSVLLDGLPILSCAYLAVRAHNKHVTTVEGVLDEIEKIADCLISEGADQCGFCTPGLAITVYAMKKELTNPTDDEIKQYLMGNLCRCSGYLGQLRGIKKYLEGAI